MHSKGQLHKFQKVLISTCELPSQKGIYVYISQWSDREYIFSTICNFAQLNSKEATNETT